MSGLRIVKVTSFALAEIIKGGQCPYTSTIPEDMEIVGIIQTALDQRINVIELVCRSAEWDSPAKGAAIPNFQPVFTTHHAEMEAPQ
jgi:hypothetical protein